MLKFCLEYNFANTSVGRNFIFPGPERKYQEVALWIIGGISAV